jgi:outer membrane lipoprotein SlyB
MTPILRFSPVIALLMLSACVTVPTGPSAMALPGTGKNFDQFRADDYECRQFASSQVGGTTTEQAATDSGVKSAAVGTIVGAAAGAAIGGSRGAATGAGAGLAVGALAGTGAAEGSQYHLQRRYDAGYMQCMYAKGHKIPVSGRFVSSQPQPPAAYSPPYPPPPPPPR